MKRNKLIFAFVAVAFLGSLVLIFSFGKQTQGKVLVDTSLDALINYQGGRTKEGVIDFGAWRVGEKENDRLFYLLKEYLPIKKIHVKANHFEYMTRPIS